MVPNFKKRQQRILLNRHGKYINHRPADLHFKRLTDHLSGQLTNEASVLRPHLGFQERLLNNVYEIPKEALILL